MSGINLTEAGCTVFVSPYSAFDLLTSKPKTAPPSPPHPVLPPASWSSQNGPVLSVLAFAPSDAPKLPLMFGRPNITGSTTDRYLATGADFSASGAYVKVQTASRMRGEEASGWKIHFDANGSSGVYGGSSTVQPSSLRLLPCIKS